MKKLCTLLLFIGTIVLNAQTNRQQLYQQLNSYEFTKQDSITFKNVLNKFKNNEFKHAKDFKVYQDIRNKTTWYHLPAKVLNNTEQHNYFTIANPYLSYGKIYLKTSEGIDSLHRTSYYKEFPFKHFFYRHPVWKIPTKNTSDIFIKVENSDNRSRMEFHLETENEFLKRTQSEYMAFGAFTAFIIAMVVILLYFAILKKEYSVIFYAIYTALMLVEFLAGKGLGIQFLWSKSDFLINSSRSFSQTLGVLFIGLFYYQFYSFSKEEKRVKQIFKWGTLTTIPLIGIYVYKFLFGGLGSYFLYVWILLKVIILVWFFTHLYLAIKKRIPHYLMIAFILPIAAIIIGQSSNPSVYSNNFIFYSGINSYYFMLIIEVLLFTRYIFSAVINSQQKYTELKKLSDELQYNFQNKTLAIQQEERNTLLSNVHDSFGGYLEALKLRLLNTNENSPEKIKEILNAFYKEYRYLLNNLHAPKVNSENLSSTLVEFFDKINLITNNSIQHNIELKQAKITSNNCVHIYRIIAELITNALKYAQASQIQIALKNTQNEITLIVNDNGIGFNPEEKKSSSYGLQNIRNRVKTMDGTLNITSKKNKGTQILIKINNNDYTS